MIAHTTTPFITIVSGATASGKSSFAVKLAQKTNAEIVNLDSVQIYKDFEIGAAKLSPEEMQAVPHHLIGVLQPQERCNVALYTQMAAKVIETITDKNKKVLFAGGSNMYITCLLQGLDELPDTDLALRAQLELMSKHELYERLQQVDSVTAALLSPNDRVRVIRALEATLISNRPASELRREHAFSKPHYYACILVLCWKRELLYKRIEQRTRLMLDSGLVEETKNLILRYGKKLPALRSLGYAQAAEYLDGRKNLQELSDSISMLTRRFAKRQMTFWRNEPQKRAWKTRPAGRDEFLQLDYSEKDNRKKSTKGFKVLTWDLQRVLSELALLEESGCSQTEVWYLDAEKIF